MDSRAVNLSYASGASDQPLIGLPISQFFDNIVARYGEREAVVSCHQGTRWTYTQLAERVNQLARAFIAAGFVKGDRVGIWSPNNVEWLCTQYATAKVGIVLVTINPAYRTHELAYVLKQAGCKGLVIQNAFKS
jgi:fatty-acyl-CoA synthase